MHENETPITWANQLHAQLIRNEDDETTPVGRYGTAAVFRQIGVLNVAIHDAVNEILWSRNQAAWRSHWSKLLDGAGLEPSPEFSTAAAPVGVAQRLLSEWHSIDDSELDQKVEEALEELVDDGADVDSGRRWGYNVATEYQYHRDDDGFEDSEKYDPSEGGQTPPGIRPIPSGDGPECNEEVHARFTGGDDDGDRWGSSHFARLDPFAMERRDQFRPGAPPDPFYVDTERWNESMGFIREYCHDSAVAANKMVEDGAVIEGFDLSVLEDADKEISDVGAFWRGSDGSVTPPGFWPLVARELALEAPEQLLPEDDTDGDISREVQLLASTARLYGWLGIAIADAGISTWDSKHVYGFWRPRLAVRTLHDEEYHTNARGGSPEYESGQAKFAGAAGAVLDAVFADQTSFELSLYASLGDRGPELETSTFERVSEAVEEAALSRFGAGNHFPFTQRESLESGRQLGTWITERTLQPTALGTQ